MSTEAYPLKWPAGRPRTSWISRERAKFDVSLARARDNVIAEVQRLVGRFSEPYTVISTNLALRRDGLPLANQRQPEDQGVAVYFTYRKRQMCFSCDRWNKIEHNMQAIAKTIEALRGIERWGTGDMLEAAFTGFSALPAPTDEPDWQIVLGLGEVLQPTREDVERAYRRAASANHPDRGGSTEQMARINRARDQAMAWLKGKS